MKFPPVKLLIIGLIITLIIRIVSFSWSVKYINSLFDNFEKVDHTHEVIENARAIEFDLAKAESDIKEFCITNNKRSYEGYKTHVKSVWIELSQFKKLMKGNKIQENNLKNLDSLILFQVALYDELVNNAIHHQIRSEDLMEKIFSVNEKIQIVSASITGEQLPELEENLRENISKSQSAIVFSGFIGFIILLMIIYLIRRDLKNKNKIEQELRSLNTNKNKFFSIIGHDLRGPIRGIVALLEMSIKHRETIDIEECLIKLNSAAKKSLNLLEIY